MSDQPTTEWPPEVVAALESSLLGETLKAVDEQDQPPTTEPPTRDTGIDPRRKYEPSYRPPGRPRRPSSMSETRMRRLTLKRAEKAASYHKTLCVICGTQLEAHVRPLLQARLTEHYQKAHPDVWASGGRPTLGRPVLR